MDNRIEKETKNVSDTLDCLHERASRADLDGYLELFAEDAVFMGTDRSERWPMEFFRPYVAKRFEGGAGWTYRTAERNVTMGPDCKTAWFDELLHHDAGEARGSGVLVLDGGIWKIAQYNLCFPIPNVLLGPFRQIIRVTENTR